MGPEAAKIIQDIGVDVIGLVDFLDYIFKDGPLSFGDFMELMLALRGTNTSTVKDIVDLRRYVASEFKTLASELKSPNGLLQTLVHFEREMNGNAGGASRNVSRNVCQLPLAFEEAPGAHGIVHRLERTC